MRRSTLSLALAAVGLSAVAMAPLAAAELQLPPAGYVFQQPPGCDRPQTGARPYDDCADQVALFQKARAEAFGAKKQVLIVFGANWCPSCRRLKPLLDGDAIGGRPFKGVALRDRVQIVEIAVSRLDGGKVVPVPSGMAVLAAVLGSRADLKLRAIPFVATVDPVTARVSARNLDDLDGPHGWNAGAIATAIAAADEETRGGTRAPAEPGWIKRKWLRWFGR